jgi:hypothetical protein
VIPTGCLLSRSEFARRPPRLLLKLAESRDHHWAMRRVPVNVQTASGVVAPGPSWGARPGACAARWHERLRSTAPAGTRSYISEGWITGASSVVRFDGSTVGAIDGRTFLTTRYLGQRLINVQNHVAGGPTTTRNSACIGGRGEHARAAKPVTAYVRRLRPCQWPSRRLFSDMATESPSLDRLHHLRRQGLSAPSRAPRSPSSVVPNIAALAHVRAIGLSYHELCICGRLRALSRTGAPARPPTPRLGHAT